MTKKTLFSLLLVFTLAGALMVEPAWAGPGGNYLSFHMKISKPEMEHMEATLTQEVQKRKSS